MYSWDEDTSSWYGEGTYSYGSEGSAKRMAEPLRRDDE